MSDKIKILEAAVKKISGEQEFMSFVLNKYMELENMSKSDLISSLKCSIEDYYKLGLCKAPKAGSTDFVDRLNNISQYTHTSVLELNKIIKRVDSISKFSGNLNNSAWLMAARDKKNDDKKD